MTNAWSKRHVRRASPWSAQPDGLTAHLSSGGSRPTRQVKDHQIHLMVHIDTAAVTVNMYHKPFQDSLCRPELAIRSLTGWGQDNWDACRVRPQLTVDRKSTRLNSSHLGISYAVFCL